MLNSCDMSEKVWKRWEILRGKNDGPEFLEIQMIQMQYHGSI